MTAVSTSINKSVCVLALSVALAIGILGTILIVSGGVGTGDANPNPSVGENAGPVTAHDSETCPIADSFRFTTTISLAFPPGFEAEKMCTKQEIDTMSSVLQTAANGAEFDPKLHISDFSVSSTCNKAHDNRQLGLFVSISHYFVVQEGRCMFCGNGGVDGNSRMLRANDLGTTVQRRTTADGELCGCHGVNFADAITPTTDCTNEYLLSNGISVLAEDTTNTATMDFVRPILLRSITDSDDVVFSAEDTNGNKITLGINDMMPSVAVSSLTLMAGAINKVEYCYEACPEAKSLFDEETADIEAELNDLLDEALEAAAIPCLEGIDVHAEVKITAVPIDQPMEC